MKKLKDETLFRTIRNFLTVYLPDQKLCSKHTVKAYRETIALLFNFLEMEKQTNLSDITFKMLDSEMILEFLNWLENARGNNVSTRNQRLTCIRAFFNYASKMNPALIVFQNELRKIPIKRAAKSNVVDYLTENALRTILNEPDITTRNGVRDLFFMILLYDLGARNREILDLRLRDIDINPKCPCVCVTGKGAKKRIVPIMEKTVTHFQKYINIFHADSYDNDSYLFYVERHGQRQSMSDDNVARFIKGYGEIAKEKCPEVPDRVHPHQFRHARAMHLYRGGMPLVLISEWLGHAQLETTLIYAYADTEMKREAIKKATCDSNPVASNIPTPWKNDDELIKKLYGLK